MKSIREEIIVNKDSSFRLMVNPRLSDFFFWHFHPEYELVFIDNASGTRHVGEHISRFEGSDLVFIGSNIPHLNFDYGVKSAYQKMVVHIPPNFIKTNLTSLPEMQNVVNLFEKSMYGITFGKETKLKLKSEIMHLHKLNAFDLFLKLIEIFNELGKSADYTLLNDKPYKNQKAIKEHKRISTIYEFVDANYQRKIPLEEVAYLVSLSKEAFCRYFKKNTKLTFTDFVNHYRINQSKILILEGKNISEAAYESGFDNVSYFNRIFKKITKENPNNFKKKHLNNTNI